jgi:hypothetical protein
MVHERLRVIDDVGVRSGRIVVKVVPTAMRRVIPDLPPIQHI